MKNSIRVVLACLALLLTHCGEGGESNESTTNATLGGQEPGNNSNRLFGYFAGAMDGLGGSTDFVPELAQSGNFVFLATGKLEEKLTQCEQLGLKAMVNFDWLILDGNYNLKPSFEQDVDALIVPILNRHLNTVIALYALDEPYMNGKNAGKTPAEIHQILQRVGGFFKSRFPNTPNAIIFSANELKDEASALPSTFDWFGFDCYNNFQKCEGHPVPWYHSLLKSRVQKLIDTDGVKRYLMSVPPSGHPKGDTQGENGILFQIPYYKKLVMNDPMVKVVIPFLWQSFDSGRDAWVGVRDLSNAKKEYLKFYQDFTK